jgi:uncharacterized protein YgiM (DUF1202 family)
MKIMENNETEVIVNETVENQEVVETTLEEVTTELIEETVEETENEPEVEVEEQPETEVEPEETESNEEESSELTGVVTAAKLNVRELPEKTASVVCVLNKDDELSIAGEHGDFYEVVTADGKNGFCVKQFIDCK